MKDDFEVFELIVKKGTFKEHLKLKEDFFSVAIIACNTNVQPKQLWDIVILLSQL